MILTASVGYVGAVLCGIKRDAHSGVNKKLKAGPRKGAGL